MRLPQTLIVLGAGMVLLLADRPAAQRAGYKLTTDVECAAILGTGAKSKRTFCDVLTGKVPADSLRMTIPRHTGTATLQFDLHNRFTVPIVSGGALAYSRQDAMVSVVRGTGEVIDRAAIVREFRTIADLFDQVASTGRGGTVREVGPGPAEPIRMVIPAGVSEIGIVGDRLVSRTAMGTETFNAPGRPIAVVSNLRIEYRPAR